MGLFVTHFYQHLNLVNLSPSTSAIKKGTFRKGTSVAGRGTEREAMPHNRGKPGCKTFIDKPVKLSKMSLTHLKILIVKRNNQFSGPIIIMTQITSAYMKEMMWTNVSKIVSERSIQQIIYN